jgi:predicted DCC family thiol-disulfide oxidoreductase YuxK
MTELHGITEVKMNERYPLTVYFDASCRLCNSEMQAIKIHDTEQRLILADCSAIDFDDAPFRADGITREAMMECLHVLDSNGRWIKGVDAFELLYQTVGMTALAYLWGGKLTRPLADRIYPWVARHRQLISCTGIPLLFTLWGKFAARRAHKRSRKCHDGQCSI